MPMPHLITEGRITKGKLAVPHNLPGAVNHARNGIAIAQARGKKKGWSLSGEAWKDTVDQSGNHQPSPPIPCPSTRFLDSLLVSSKRHQLDTDVKLIPVPAAQTVANMKTGNDGCL